MTNDELQMYTLADNGVICHSVYTTNGRNQMNFSTALTVHIDHSYLNHVLILDNKSYLLFRCTYKLAYMQLGDINYGDYNYGAITIFKYCLQRNP